MFTLGNVLRQHRMKLVRILLAQWQTKMGEKTFFRTKTKLKRIVGHAMNMK